MKYISFVFLLLFVSSLTAQLGINIGAGANFSSVRSANFPSITTSATNFYLSARPEIKIMKNLRLSLDIQFSRRGFFSDDSNTGIIQTFDGMRFDYLDLIPQVEYELHPVFRLYTGLAVAIQNNESVLIDKVWQKFTSKLSNTNDLAYVIGFRVFPIQNLSIQLQYAGSMTSLFDIVFTDDKGNIIDDGNYFFRNIQLGVSYKLF